MVVCFFKRGYKLDTPTLDPPPTRSVHFHLYTPHLFVSFCALELGRNHKPALLGELCENASVKKSVQELLVQAK